MKNIAIIPIRSGSKGLPHKNIRPLAGHPLVAYTIQAALKSKMFDRVMVSTDSEEYAEVARKYGAEVPFLRSAENSGDRSGSWDVVKEVLDRYEKEMGEVFDSVALLQATSPLRLPEHIAQAYQRMEELDANSIIGICDMEFPLSTCSLLPKSLDINEGTPLVPKARDMYIPRQMDQEAVRTSGAIFLYKVKALYTDARLYDTKSYGFKMDKIHVVDIDDLDDFTMAEALIRHLPEFQGYFD